MSNKVCLLKHCCSINLYWLRYSKIPFWVTTLRSLLRKAKGRDTPDAIRRSNQFLKVDKTANGRKFKRYVEQITQNVIALLNT
jgi:hypothetical protein